MLRSDTARNSNSFRRTFSARMGVRMEAEVDEEEGGEDLVLIKEEDVPPGLGWLIGDK